MIKQTNHARSIFLILLFLSFIVTATVLKLTSSFFIPLTVSVMLSFVFYPLLKGLNKKAHIPWILGVLIFVALTLASFFIIGNLLVASMSTIVSAYPNYESKITSVYTAFAKTFNIPFDQDASVFTNLWNSLQVRTTVQSMAISLSNYMLSGAKVVLVIGLLVIFLLIEARDFHSKVSEAFAGKEDFTQKIIRITTKTISQVTRYISIKFAVSIVTGLLVGISTAIIRMDFPIVWGFLAFILNFIPNFGSIISWGLTTLFATAQFAPSWGPVIYVAVIVLAINTAIGNIIEPRWEGNDLGISPFIILVSLLLWGWMWGFIGMILAVPIMVILKITCENIEMLKPLAILMGTRHKTTGNTAPVQESSDCQNTQDSPTEKS